MAQRVQVLLTDDIDGSEASETISFSLDGVSYDIDLNDENSAALRASLAPYIDGARREKNTRGRRGTASSRREDTTAIRAWAKANGHTVSDRGRIPASVSEAFKAAHA